VPARMAGVCVEVCVRSVGSAREDEEGARVYRAACAHLIITIRPPPSQDPHVGTPLSSHPATRQ